MSYERSLVLVTRNGFVTRNLVDDYYSRIRGVKGVIGISLDSDDFVVASVVCFDGDDLIFTTSKGRVVKFNVDHLKIVSRKSRGVRAMILEKGDFISSVVRTRFFDEIKRIANV